eukprot:TRINITY_DN1652_c0_g1::TRINITY_DN1652_c0_g1_i1::g.17698::m.17698 TRINITY_DN1652_c0_g1::TRINITY_DN1652_c0_g1_i1::g.17698  ORF type:complete len:1060 (+),score=345.35,DUF3712/PF12505.3/3.7e+02,DUF3712/PF12505.3/1.1e-16,DUF3712/PF12505.3/1.3e-09,DUF3712/PF12505.3/1e-09,DUF3712/PF12505.3/7.4e+03,LEA_2/PF03168.8/24,LEA_2/PF03168.8/97,LEA_2/PF03168.8/5.5e+03,LEA_2/PF03168.8/89,LEA_2/PF03168.8/3.3e+03,LEA_2/PF03168.8/7.4e+02,LEA_2/PF03168.8/1.1,LEA_2/PF03168.8/45 TRINITY_DN1652_c0_g1_i1:113-3292(+)
MEDLKKPLLQDEEIPVQDDLESQTNYHDADVLADEETQTDPQRKRYCFNILTGPQLAMAVFALLGVLCVSMYFAGHSMAQQGVDDSEVEFKSVMITQPRNDMKGFTISANASLYNPLFMKAQIEGMSVKVHNVDEHVGWMDMPTLKIDASTNTDISVTADFEIRDVDAFTRFAKALINEPSIKWKLKSKTSVAPHIFGNNAWPTFEDINFEKSVNVRACDGLKDVKIVEVDLTESDGETVRITAVTSLINPSIVGMEPIGDLTMDIFFRDKFVGRTIAANVSVKTGTNQLVMKGWIKPAPEDLPALADLLANYLNQKPTPVQAIAPNDIASNIPLYRDALAGLTLNVDFPGSPSQTIMGLEVAHIDLQPLDNVHTFMGMDLVIRVYNPLGDNSPVNISAVAMDATMFYNGISVGHIHVPRVPVSNGIIGYGKETVDVRISAEVVMDEGFELFAIDFLKADALGMRLVGKMQSNQTCTLGDLTLNDLDVDVSVHTFGMGGLSDVTIGKIDLPANHPDGGVILLTDMILRNPSDTAMVVGDVIFDVMYKGKYMATLKAADTTLAPGANALKLEGRLLPAQEDLEIAGEFFSQYLNGQDSIIHAVGSDACTDMATYPIAWVQNAIRSLDIETVFPGGDFDIMGDINIQNLKVGFDSNDQPITSGTFTAAYALPFGFPVTITAVSLKIEYFYNEMSFGFMYVPFMSVTQPETGLLLVNLDSVPLTVSDAQKPGFTEFVFAVLNTTNIALRLRGSIDARAMTNFGEITITGMALDKPVALIGTNAFRTSPIEVTRVDILDGPTEIDLSLVSDMSIFNPSNVWGDYGPMSFGLYYKGVKVSVATMDAFKLDMGANTLTNIAVAFTTPSGENQAIAYEFLGKYISGQTSDVELYGERDSTPIDLLKDAVSRLRVAFPFKGRSSNLITGVTLHVQFIGIISDAIFKEVEAVLEVDNTYGIDLVIEASDTDVFHEFHRPDRIAYYESNAEPLPITQPKYAKTKTPKLPISLESIFSSSKAIIQLLTKGGDLDLEGYFTCRLGNFRAVLFVQQYDMPTTAEWKLIDLPQ